MTARNRGRIAVISSGWGVARPDGIFFDKNAWMPVQGMSDFSGGWIAGVCG